MRRDGQRRKAADAFADAAALFTSMRAKPWAERAAAAARSAVPRPSHDNQLTHSERQVAELAATGARNAEIAASLFVTVATVKAHLTRAHRKLGVRSRAGMASRLTEKD